MGLTKLQQATSDHVFEVLINKKIIPLIRQNI